MHILNLSLSLTISQVYLNLSQQSLSIAFGVLVCASGLRYVSSFFLSRHSSCMISSNVYHCCVRYVGYIPLKLTRPLVPLFVWNEGIVALSGRAEFQILCA